MLAKMVPCSTLGDARGGAASQRQSARVSTAAPRRLRASTAARRCIVVAAASGGGFPGAHKARQLTPNRAEDFMHHFVVYICIILRFYE